MRVLIVEDGTEYTDTMTRFAGGEATWERAGSWAEALARLDAGGVDAVFLDMRFDRVPNEALLGDVEATASRLGGDRSRAVRFLQENQGALILGALRAAGHSLPVLFSYNFGEEPRRWLRVQEAHAPVGYASDAASPTVVVGLLRGLLSTG